MCGRVAQQQHNQERADDGEAEHVVILLTYPWNILLLALIAASRTEQMRWKLQETKSDGRPENAHISFLNRLG
jgi:hypothetical protein